MHAKYVLHLGRTSFVYWGRERSCRFSTPAQWRLCAISNGRLVIPPNVSLAHSTDEYRESQLSHRSAATDLDTNGRWAKIEGCVHTSCLNAPARERLTTMRHRLAIGLLPFVLLAGCRPLPVLAPLTSRELQRQTAQAEAEFLNGHFGNAEALYQGVAERAPSPRDRARARYWRGVCRLKLGRGSEARSDFQSYLSDPVDSGLEFEAREGLADCAREQEYFDEAAGLYESLAASTSPSSRKASLLRRLAECRSKAGDSTGAMQARRMASKLGKARETPDPERAAKADNEFAVQLGAFSKRRAADELAKRIRAHGLPGEVLPRQVKGRQLYCVRSGQFSEKPSAERHAQKLKRIGFDAIVVP